MIFSRLEMVPILSHEGDSTENRIENDSVHWYLILITQSEASVHDYIFYYWFEDPKTFRIVVWQICFKKKANEKKKPKQNKNLSPRVFVPDFCLDCLVDSSDVKSRDFAEVRIRIFESKFRFLK